jgi:formate--tetrahydrofolate ligase
MTDIEIARKANKLDIHVVANKLGISDIECYGNDKAKIDYTKYNNKTLGKLILVTSINPTPYGEGKTTLSIGINDALRKLNKNSVAVLREPSLGPVFGVKGGATGGGYSQIIPMEDINLHFTGDMHAITTCNNLLCALIDNHIYQGNELNINPNSICFHRCIDMNDRILRDVNLYNRREHFSITAASEIMAILCLANDFNDLRNKLNNILIGYTYDNKPVFASDLNCVDSLLIILKDAIKPNLVQSLENNPVIIHGGPFANIAHGCNSIIATKLGLSLCDYVITEAGFGADLGAEKFFNIKCRNNLKPDLVIINVTLKALKHNGYCPKEEISKPNINYIKKGVCNLEAHINNIKKFTSNILVVLNKYDSDTIDEIDYLKEYVESLNIPFEVSEAYSKGSNGALNVANKVIQYCDKENDFKFLYDLNDSINNKIETIIKEIYHTSNIKYSELALNKIKQIEKINSNLPICVAKTQASISDNPKLLGNPINYEITVKDLEIKNGAGFIIVFLGDIIDMPGLSKNPNALNMKIDNNQKITGLF